MRPSGLRKASERLRQPRTSYRLAPVNVGLSGGPVLRDAGPGQHAHRLAKRQTFADSAALDRLNCSRVRPSRSRSISTHLPRTNANPSDCASNCLISAAERLSPSSVTSIRKLSSASSPNRDGALSPIVAFTCGRAGRFMRQLAGIRTTTPALFERGNVLKKLQCLLRAPAQRVKNFAASIMVFSQGQFSPARWTGISNDRRRSRFFAPAYSCRAFPSGRCCAFAAAESRVV